MRAGPRGPARTRRGARAAGDMTALLDDYVLTVPPLSRDRHRRLLGAWFTWCRRQPVRPERARRSDVDRYLNELGETRAPSTVAHHLGAIAGYYGYAVAERRLDVDPTRGIRRPQVARVSRGTWLYRDELDRLLTEADRDPDLTVRALAYLLGLHGCRLGEVLALDAADVRVRRERTVVTLTRKGYGGQATDLVLAAPVAERVRAAIGDRTSGPVLRHFNGARLPPYTARQMIAGLAILAEIPGQITPHSLRRTFITLGRDAGISDRDLQASSGHRGPNMIDYYDRGRDSVVRDAGDQLTAWLNRDTHQPEPIVEDFHDRIGDGLSGLTGPQVQALQRLHGIRIRHRSEQHTEAVAALVAEGWTARDIAAELTLSEARVRHAIRRDNLVLPERASQVRLEVIRRATAEGRSLAEVARLAGVTKTYASTVIRRHDLEWPWPGRRDPATVTARRERARELSAAGLDRNAIATELGVSAGAVTVYLRGDDRTGERQARARRESGERLVQQRQVRVDHLAREAGYRDLADAISQTRDLTPTHAAQLIGVHITTVTSWRT